MPGYTLTAANSTFSLTIPQVFGANPQTIAGYAVDDAFETENVSPSEAVIGVDALMSAGYTPYLIILKLVLMATSPSIYDTMNPWLGAMAQACETYYANGVIILPGVQTVYTFTRGSLTGAIIMPGVKKQLQQVSYEIKFQSCVPSPYSP
jgi:hypothetical protein